MTQDKQTTIRETLSLSQLSRMLNDLKRFEARVLNNEINMDVGIVEDDILSMEYRIADKKKEET